MRDMPSPMRFAALLLLAATASLGAGCNVPEVSFFDADASDASVAKSGLDGETDAPEAEADAGLDAGLDAQTDAGPETGLDAAPDAETDAAPETGFDAGPDAEPDAGPDGGTDAKTNVEPDAGPDAETDARTNVEPDAGPDAEADAGPDGETDARSDAMEDAESPAYCVGPNGGAPPPGLACCPGGRGEACSGQCMPKACNACLPCAWPNVCCTTGANGVCRSRC